VSAIKRIVHYREPREVEFVVPGEAKTERKRQRFIKALGRAGKRTDEPDRADYKARISERAFAECREPLQGPLLAEFVIIKVKPDSYPKNPTQGNPWPDHWWKKPDGGNFEKLVSDALTGIVWGDDAQVTDLVVRKRFGDRDELRIRVVELIGGVQKALDILAAEGVE
jgi:Holliday junction resolvase RusA-like endonuclease